MYDMGSVPRNTHLSPQFDADASRIEDVIKSLFPHGVTVSFSFLPLPW